MAEGGAGSSNANRQEEDGSYFGELTRSFLATYNTWRAENHAPQTNQEYVERQPRSQTATCARVASLHYQIEKGVSLLHVTGIDSHVFRRSWVGAPSDNWLCFHANFRAFVHGDLAVSFFFAELVGINGPHVVTKCVRLVSRRDYSVKNCRFCTGMWHPVGGNFLGYAGHRVARAGRPNQPHP